ncbi:MAG: enoyl-CoA hydratase/isomerase family protein [Kofleriaceae bacterium]|nr:enoyl-CoA hydratase/isomerase family protein [Kofleriaceae bacterium]
MSRTRLERTDAIATLWLDRPDKRNAMDAELVKELGDAFDAIAADRSIRVVVLRGAGPVFSSGIDHSLLTGVMQTSRTQPFAHIHHQLQDTFHRMTRLQQPVIAALHGVCLGMAFEFALAADIRIASEDCVVGLPEIAFGLVPDVGGTTRLVRAAGEPRARELIMTGRLLKARTAERYGLLHEVVGPADDLAARISKRATHLASLSPAALGLAKTLCQASADSGGATSFRLEGVVQEALMMQPDLLTRFPSGLAFIKAMVADAE